MGSFGSLSPRMYGRPIRNVRPGPEFAGRAYPNLPGFALAQPFTGSFGSLSPRMYGRPIRNVRPGPEFAGRAYPNLPGFALAQASSASGVVGAVLTTAGLYCSSGPDG